MRGAITIDRVDVADYPVSVPLTSTSVSPFDTPSSHRNQPGRRSRIWGAVVPFVLAVVPFPQVVVDDPVAEAGEAACPGPEPAAREQERRPTTERGVELARDRAALSVSGMSVMPVCWPDRDHSVCAVPNEGNLVSLDGSPRCAIAADRGRWSTVVLQLGLAGAAELAAMMRCASTLPSSTPHWSKELMSQIVPCANTLCS